MKRRSRSVSPSPPLTRKRARDARASDIATATTSNARRIGVPNNVVIVESRVQSKEELDREFGISQWNLVEPTLMSSATANFSLDSVTVNDWVAVYMTVEKVYRLPSDRENVKLEFFSQVNNFLNGYVDYLMSQLTDLEGAELVEQYCNSWRTGLEFVEHMNRVFAHMLKYWVPSNRTPILDNNTAPITTISNLFLFHWRRLIRDRVGNLADELIDLVEADREGLIDASVAKLVKLSLESFLKIGSLEPNAECLLVNDDDDNPHLKFYKEVFETPLLYRTGKYYDKIAKNYARSPDDDPVRHIQAIDEILMDEENRVSRLVEKRTRNPIRVILEQKLVGNHLDLYHHYAHCLISSPATREDCSSINDSLRTIVGLLSRIENGLEPVRRAFFDSTVLKLREIVYENYPIGNDSLSKFCSYLAMINSLSRLFMYRTEMVSHAFSNRSMFTMALESAFRNVLNDLDVGTDCSMAVILGHYVNHILTGSIIDDIPLPLANSDVSVHLEVVEAEGFRINGNNGTESSQRSISREYTPDELVPLSYGFQIGSTGRPILRRSARLMKKAKRSIQPNSGRREGIEMKVRLNPSSQEREKLPLAMKECNLSSRKLEFILTNYLTQCIELFVFVENKELFIEVCRSLMAKRLKEGYSKKFESIFIKMLTKHMGPQFTGKLSGMLNDMPKIKETQSQFSKSLAAGECVVKRLHRLAPMKMLQTSEVSVMHSLYWPKFEHDTMKLPNAMLGLEHTFEDFYRLKHPRRRLTWLRYQGTVELLFRHKGRTRTLITSVPQACVLLQFNRDEEFSVRKLAKACGMDVKEMERHIAGLVNQGERSLLRVCEDDYEVEKIMEIEMPNMLESGTDSDYDEYGDVSVNGRTKYEFNPDFSCKSDEYTVQVGEKAISFSQPAAPITQPVFDRSIQVEAAIVRILKNMNKMSEDKLKKAVVEETRAYFAATNEDIENGLESLIEKELISQEDNIFVYQR